MTAAAARLHTAALFADRAQPANVGLRLARRLDDAPQRVEAGVGRARRLRHLGLDLDGAEQVVDPVHQFLERRARHGRHGSRWTDGGDGAVLQTPAPVSAFTMGDRPVVAAVPNRLRFQAWHGTCNGRPRHHEAVAQVVPAPSRRRRPRRARQPDPGQ
ncbi:MAG: hypothetical protein ACK5BN_09865 [Planctomycetota bacterium]